MIGLHAMTEADLPLVRGWLQPPTGCGLIVAPEAANAVSRRVLERNGFELVEIRPLAFEPNDSPMAIYRLPGAG